MKVLSSAGVKRNTCSQLKTPTPKPHCQPSREAVWPGCKLGLGLAVQLAWPIGRQTSVFWAPCHMLGLTHSQMNTPPLLRFWCKPNQQHPAYTVTILYVHICQKVVKCHFRPSEKFVEPKLFLYFTCQLVMLLHIVLDRTLSCPLAFSVSMKWPH